MTDNGPEFVSPGGGPVGLREWSPVALHHAGATDGEWPEAGLGEIPSRDACLLFPTAGVHGTVLNATGGVGGM